MAQLIVSLDSVVISEYRLNKERMTLGRKASNDIQVDNVAVSGEHAAIFTLANDSFVEDLNSTNGTFVNGKPVRRHLLRNGDVIGLGKHKLKYVQDSKPLGSATDYERTKVMRGNSPSDATPPAQKADAAPCFSVEQSQAAQTQIAPGVITRPQKSAELVSNPLAAIQVLTGAAAGRTLELGKELTTIGKSGGDVAVVTRRPGGYFITPVHGNPPLLNGQPLDPQARPLHDHDIIEMAGIKLEFYLKA